jgi:hypothetical protein
MCENSIGNDKLDLANMPHPVGSGSLAGLGNQPHSERRSGFFCEKFYLKGILICITYENLKNV